MARGLAAIACLAASAAALLWAAPAQATFHLWVIDEVFSNADGTVQYVEMFTSAIDQVFISGHFLRTQQGLTPLQTYTIPPMSDLPVDSANHFLLFATPAFAAAAGINPDFVIPSGFIQVGTADTVNWAGFNTFSLVGLPTDGINSLNTNGVVAVNTPTNFAGQAGHIVPEPDGPALALASLAALALLARGRRSS